MAEKKIERDPRAKPGPLSGRYGRTLLAIIVLGLTIVVFVVISSMRGGKNEGEPGFFDPTTTDPEELRRVAEAVSRIIASTTPAQHNAAEETLESVRANSAGARDLKDSCVNTYGGTIRAQRIMDELTAIVRDPDGGERNASDIPPDQQVRAAELERNAREQVELVHQSRDRCMDLYLAAVRRLGLTPAQRP